MSLLNFIGGSALFLVSGCTQIGSSHLINKEMITSSERVCAQNGSVKLIEYWKDKESHIYVYCQKQGVVEIDQAGKVLVMTSKVNAKFQLVSSEEYKTCKNKCNSIKSISLPFECECEK